MRQTSAQFTRMALGYESGDNELTLLKIEHDQLDAPILLVNDPNQGIKSNGVWYERSYFQASLFSDNDGQGRANLTVQNVDRRIGEGIDLIMGPASVSLFVILAGEPDAVIYSADDIDLINVTIDALTVTGEMTYLNDYSEPATWQRLTPRRFPYAFK